MKLSKKEIASAVQKAAVGFLIPINGDMPKLYAKDLRPHHPFLDDYAHTVDYDEHFASEADVRVASPQRRVPPCAHAEACGGCAWMALEPAAHGAIFLDELRRFGLNGAAIDEAGFEVAV